MWNIKTSFEKSHEAWEQFIEMLRNESPEQRKKRNAEANRLAIKYSKPEKKKK